MRESEVKPASKKQAKKSGTIGTKIVAMMLFTVLLIMGIVGTLIFIKVKAVDEVSYEDKLENTLAVTDAALDTYFENFESLANLYVNIDIIKEDDDSITSYVNKTSPTGKIPADPENFGEYEYSVYSLAKTFVDAKNELEGISIALESNGAFVRYPSEPRSNNYDSRGRSWYKNAKAKNGGVNFSNAYLASAGYKTIAISKYFNDKYGRPRGVVSIDANVNYISDILKATQDGTGDELFLLVDQTGTILVDQLRPENEFKKLTEIGNETLAAFKHGDKIRVRESVSGIKYEFRSFVSNNKYIPMDYIMVIPVSVVDAADNAIFSSLIFAAVISIVIAVIISFIMRSVITIPLKKTVDVLKNISEGEGDLTQRLPVKGNDEITMLSKYFNKSFEKISDVVSSVINESQVMTNVASDLSDDMSETASAINQISSNISSIKGEIVNQSAGVEETTATMRQITDNIEKLSKNIDVQTSSVAQSSSSIEEMVANIRSVTDILDKNAHSVEELADSADNGRDVVKKAVELIERISSDSEGLMEATTVIQNIASQTNLLAMNAAIEAAHAGDVGKGFSVVADEIRKLAEDSSVQGKKIADVLGGLKDLISNVSSASKGIQDQFNIIFENTQKVSQQEAVIKSAMDEQSAGSQQILNAMQEISNITNEVRDGAVLMEQGGREIMIEMDKLASVTSEISGSMNEMSIGVSEINNAMQRVNEKTSENGDSIGRVTSELNKFKV